MSLDVFDPLVQAAREAGLAPCIFEPTGRAGLVCCVVHRDLVEKGRDLCDAALAVANGEDADDALAAQRDWYMRQKAKRPETRDHFPEASL